MRIIYHRASKFPGIVRFNLNEPVVIRQLITSGKFFIFTTEAVVNI